MSGPELSFDGSADAGTTLVLAHGAGAPMDSPFMEHVVAGIAGTDVRVARFEFPYMRKRRLDGRRRAPDRQDTLLACWRAVISELGSPHRLVIGGKSLGARMASMVADESRVLGLVCLGYPFHPPGRPERTRTAHLMTLRTPALIVQGERDAFGARREVDGYTLPDTIRVHWSGDGDHSLKPRKSSGRSEAQNLSEAVQAVVEFIQGLKHSGSC